VQEVLPLKLESTDKWSQVWKSRSWRGGELVAPLDDKADGKLDIPMPWRPTTLRRLVA